MSAKNGSLKELSTQEEIKKLYRKLATWYHPGKPSGDLRTMQEINADYDRAMSIADDDVDGAQNYVRGRHAGDGEVGADDLWVAGG